MKKTEADFESVAADLARCVAIRYGRDTSASHVVEIRAALFRAYTEGHTEVDSEGEDSQIEAPIEEPPPWDGQPIELSEHERDIINSGNYIAATYSIRKRTRCGLEPAIQAITAFRTAQQSKECNHGTQGCVKHHESETSQCWVIGG